MQQDLIRYYKDILTEPWLDSKQDIGKITRHIRWVLTWEENEALMRPIILEEVEIAIKYMETNKPHGLDGFTMDLFHHCCPFIKDKVWKIVKNSRKTQSVLISFC